MWSFPDSKFKLFNYVQKQWFHCAELNNWSTEIQRTADVLKADLRVAYI